MCLFSTLSSFFFFNDTAPTEIYTLSLHDALPILATTVTIASRNQIGNGSLIRPSDRNRPAKTIGRTEWLRSEEHTSELRHVEISYAVFCLKKKKSRRSVMSIRYSAGQHGK